MFLSIFDIFKIGIGPSSSHTMGPMLAAGQFLKIARACETRVDRIRCSLHGSLAFTGKGHATDRAVILGLAGFTPERFDIDKATVALDDIRRNRILSPRFHHPYRFDPETDIRFDYEVRLPGHTNGMVLYGLDREGSEVVRETYYSIGGGFVLTEAELRAQATSQEVVPDVPYPFRTALELVEMAEASGKSVAGMMMENECAIDSRTAVRARILKIWRTMKSSIDAGLSQDGILPGGLNVRRRAKGIHDSLKAERGLNRSAPHVVNDWISAYAMAVNEQNAVGAQVVTAPTNGAAGVVPATFRYFLDHVSAAREEHVIDYLLTAAAIGGIIKTNASISGAEVGCQGEVGSASAMAAAGLCAILGGTPRQVENAAEIALEHHLGMTCDPIKGLVQAPCIERNGLGAIKAVSSASLALRGDGKHLVPLDSCIKTMRETGLDMNEKYKETSLGGLAVNLPAC